MSDVSLSHRWSSLPSDIDASTGGVQYSVICLPLFLLLASLTAKSKLASLNDDGLLPGSQTGLRDFQILSLLTPGISSDHLRLSCRRGCRDSISVRPVVFCTCTPYCNLSSDRALTTALSVALARIPLWVCSMGLNCPRCLCLTVIGKRFQTACKGSINMNRFAYGWVCSLQLRNPETKFLQCNEGWAASAPALRQF